AMTFEGGELSAGLGIPHLSRAVFRTGNDAGPVRGYCDASHPTSVALEDGELGASVGIPDPGGVVLRTGDNAGPIQAHRYAGYRTTMALENTELPQHAACIIEGDRGRRP